MGYLQVSKTYYIDTETFKFIHVSQRVSPFKVEVPFYYWNFPESTTHRFSNPQTGEAGIYTNVHAVQLHHLIVEFSMNYRHARLNFYDVVRKDWTTIGISCKPYLTNSGSMFAQVTAFDYTIAIETAQKQFRVPLDLYNQQFFMISDIYSSMSRLQEYGSEKFSFGITPSQYTVMCNSRQLNGESYAFVCGPWAVLLTDDLSFDSLALLSGADGGLLKVDKFAYTVNPYVMKIMTLMR